jgi:hypothetical protein
MRIESSSSPDLVPSSSPEETVYLVLEDLGKLGRVYQETDVKTADVEDVVADFLSGQFEKPVRVVAFNTVQGWARDVSEDVAWEILKRSVAEGTPLSAGTRAFAVFHLGEREALLAENAIV